MNFPKSDIYNLIKQVKVAGQTLRYVQNMPEKFEELPTISYSNCINNPTFCLKNTIGKETISVQIDIWSKSSSLNTLILKTLTNVMLGNEWQLVTAQDMGKIDEIYRTMTKVGKVM